MKLKISWNWMFYILCLLCFTFCSKNEAEPPPPANGQIKVIVKNSLGTRLGAVNLTLVNGKTFLYGITQENGEFTFNKVPVGENTIIASVEHYLNESVTTKLSADEETSINIEMKAGEGFFSIEKTSLDVNFPGGFHNFEVKSNAAWSIKSNADWVVIENNQGNGNSTARVNILKNEGDDSRTTTIDFIFGDKVTPVAVTQVAPIKLKSFTNGETPLTDSIYLVFNKKIKVKSIRAEYTLCVPDDIGQRSIEGGKGVQIRYGCASLGGSYPFTYSVTDEHGNMLTERIEIDFFTKKFAPVNESFSNMSISDDNKTIWVNVHTDTKWFFQGIDIETMKIRHRIPLPEPPNAYAFNPYNKLFYVSSYYYTTDWEHKPGLFVIDPSKGEVVKKITLEHLPEYYDSWPRLAPANPIFTASGLGMFEVGHRIGYDNNKMLIDSRNNDALSYFNPIYSIHIPTSGLPIYYERQLTDNKRKIVGYDQYSRKLAVFDGEYGNFVDFIDVPVPFPHNPYLWTNKKNDRLFVKGYWEETIIDVKTKQRLGTSYNGFTPLGFSYRENEEDYVFGLADDYFFLLDYSNSETIFYFPMNRQGGWISGGATTTDGKYVVIANERGITVYSEKMFPKKKDTQQRMRMQSYGSKGVMKRVF